MNGARPSDLVDDVPAMMLSRRCLARNRRGSPCQAPAVKGRRRCRLHGGKSSGPPQGNQNALKHGYYTAKAIDERREVRACLAEFRRLLRTIE